MQLGQNITLREYWDKVLAIAATLPDVVAVISVEDQRTGAAGGAVSECDRKTAAQLIFMHTHREATSKEVAADRAAQDVRRAHYANIERERKQQNLNLPPEMAAMFTLAVSKMGGGDEKKNEPGEASGQAKGKQG